MRFKGFSIVCIILGASLSATAFSGSLYWYVDDDGITHFASAPEGSGSQSGQMEYQDIPDDSVIDNGNGTTTRIIDASQFSNQQSRRLNNDNTLHQQNNLNRNNTQKTYHEEDFE